MLDAEGSASTVAMAVAVASCTCSGSSSVVGSATPPWPSSSAPSAALTAAAFAFVANMSPTVGARFPRVGVTSSDPRTVDVSAAIAPRSADSPPPPAALIPAARKLTTRIATSDDGTAVVSFGGPR